MNGPSQAIADVPFKLSPDLKDRVKATICSRIRQSIQAMATRDDILRQYTLQVDGLSQPLSDGPWNGSCQLDDPLTPELSTRVTSYLMASSKADPKCIMSAVTSDDDDLVSSLELAFQAKLQQWNIQRMLYDLAYHAVVYPFAVCSVRWKQDIAQIRKMVPADPETGEALVQERAEFLQGQSPDELPKVPAVQEEVTSEGPVVKSIYPRDMYFWPAEAQSIEDANLCIERILMSEQDLYDGIKGFGFDKDTVMEMIRQGPTGRFTMNTQTQEQNRLDGIDGAKAGGYWELFLVEGNWPFMLDDDGDVIREDLNGQRMIGVFCEYADTMLRYGPKTLPEASYSLVHIIRTPNRMMGKCVPQLVQVMQEQLTALLRLQVNIAEFTSNPMMALHSSDRDLNDNAEAFPGAFLFFTQVAPQAIRWDTSSVPILINTQEQLLQRCNQMVGAGVGVSELAPPAERTATEISTVNEAASQIRDLMTDTWRDSLGPVYKLIFTLWMSNMEETGEQVMTAQGPISVKPIDVENRILFSANGNSSTSSPQARMQSTQMKIQVQQQYIQAYQACLMGQLSPTALKWAYHGARAILTQSGERSPEGWIGREPQGQDPEAILNQVMQSLSQVAQQDPNVVPILQGIQSAMQQAMPEGAGGMGMGKQQSQGMPKMSMNYKDIPPDDQQAMLQMAGLPASRNGSSPQPQGVG